MFHILYKEFLRRYTDWLDPFSSQLLDRLKADDGSLHPALALEYLLQYPDKVPNLYVSKTMSFIKQDVSLIESSLACCWDPHYRGAGIALFETILERAKHVKDHDETIAGKVMEWALISELRSKELGSAPNKPYALLFNFYKDKLSQIDINDVSSFFVHQQSPQDAFAHHFEDFPPHQIWRLFIDAKLQKSENGWLDYEHREPGALMAMLNCIKFLEDNISALVNIDLLKNIQKLCSSSVNNLTSEIYPGEFRDNEKVGYGLKMGKNLSLRGFFELDSNITQGDKDYYFTHDKIYDCRFESRALSTEEINNKVQRLIDLYNANMLNDIMQPADKLRRIIHFITELERLHPFPDVNCRTICIFLLNRELMRYGFSPVILEDPNFFDGYAITELCNEVINGMENFRKVKQGQFFGLSNDEIFEKINASDNTSQDLETFAALQEPELSCFIRSPASSFSS